MSLNDRLSHFGESCRVHWSTSLGCISVSKQRGQIPTFRGQIPTPEFKVAWTRRRFPPSASIGAAPARAADAVDFYWALQFRSDEVSSSSSS
eukprot:scaffold2730_cov109-Skeletonema_menzelii.AAC.3